MPNYMPYMQQMGLSRQCCPMMEMPQEQLESMYPRVYNIVYPHVKHHCDMYHSQYGMMQPTREHLESMIDDIHRKVEVEVDMEVSTSRDTDNRQLGFGGRRLLRDLVGILLLRQFINPFGGFYGGYPGFYGGFYGAYPVGYGVGYPVY